MLPSPMVEVRLIHSKFSKAVVTHADEKHAATNDRDAEPIKFSDFKQIGGETNVLFTCAPKHISLCIVTLTLEQPQAWTCLCIPEFRLTPRIWQIKKGWTLADYSSTSLTPIVCTTWKRSKAPTTPKTRYVHLLLLPHGLPFRHCYHRCTPTETQHAHHHHISLLWHPSPC